MNADWQTWAAAGVVLVTAIIFTLRMTRKKKAGGCNNCGSGGPPVKRR